MLTGPTVVDPGETAGYDLSLTVTPAGGFFTNSVSGLLEDNVWDSVQVTFLIDRGDGGPVEQRLVVDTSAPALNLTTVSPFDYESLLFGQMFDATYAAPGDYTLSVTGTVEFFGMRDRFVSEEVCTSYASVYGFRYCIKRETQISVASPTVVTDRATFSFAQNISVPAPLPLPASGWVMLAGLGGLALVRRRRGQA